jgi:hypothetical protein
MMPASTNVTKEKVVEQIEHLRNDIDAYTKMYEQMQFNVPTTMAWLINSMMWLYRMREAVEKGTSSIEKSSETILSAFNKLKDGFSVYAKTIMSVQNAKIPSGTHTNPNFAISVNLLQKINRDFLFLEPNLHKLIEIGFKTQEQINQAFAERMKREGFVEISPEDLSLTGVHATVNFGNTFGGREQMEGRFARGTNGRLILMMPNKRKSGYILNPPVYAKFKRTVQSGGESPYKPTFNGKQGRLF